MKKRYFKRRLLGTMIILSIGLYAGLQIKLGSQFNMAKATNADTEVSYSMKEVEMVKYAFGKLVDIFLLSSK
jgi:hypothetical protein